MDEQDLGWLVRDNTNRIRGPYRHAEIAQLIKKGQLKGKTEIARANSYWFAIEEKAEIERFFPEFGVSAKPTEQHTQMTSTLVTEAASFGGAEPADATRVTGLTSPNTQKTDGSTPAPSAAGKAEWLSDEFAAEFGDAATIEMEISQQTQKPEAAEPVSPLDAVKAQQSQNEHELLSRASVKADTLPSERKDYNGDRPKPIDSMIRNPGKGSAVSATQSVVNMPVDHGIVPKMVHEEEEAPRSSGGDKKVLIVLLCAVLLLTIGASVYYFTSIQRAQPVVVAEKTPPPQRKGPEAEMAARQSVVLFNLEGAKSALADMELDSATKTSANTYLLQALLKKEFLFDVEGAMVSLQAAKAQARSKRTEAEVNNLMAVYGFEQDKSASLEIFRRNVEAFPDDSLFRYNFALALVLNEKIPEAIPIFDSVLSSLSLDNPLVEDVSFDLGWALEVQCKVMVRGPICKRSTGPEDAFLRALSSNPFSARARLGLALHRLRSGGIRSAEADFRAFLDLAPNLDPPSQVMNFRKLNDAAFFAFAHQEIVELNSPSQSGARPSTVIMAADAVISSMNGGTSEAGKIIESALVAAPGDVNVLKAVGYIRWKDGKLDEVIEALKDLREKSSFAINLMLGKAYSKQRRKDMAEKYFRNLADFSPNSSEGHALLGELFLDQYEKVDEAKIEFRAALKKDPLDLVALRGLVRAEPSVKLNPELFKNLPF